jgi:hypothetical protein
MPVAEPDLDRTVHDAATALTVARGRTDLLRRRLADLAGDRERFAAGLDQVRAALDRVRDDLHTIADECAEPLDNRATGAGAG